MVIYNDVKTKGYYRYRLQVVNMYNTIMQMDLPELCVCVVIGYVREWMKESVIE